MIASCRWQIVNNISEVCGVGDQGKSIAMKTGPQIFSFHQFTKFCHRPNELSKIAIDFRKWVAVGQSDSKTAGKFTIDDDYCSTAFRHTVIQILLRHLKLCFSIWFLWVLIVDIW